MCCIKRDQPFHCYLITKSPLPGEDLYIQHPSIAKDKLLAKDIRFSLTLRNMSSTTIIAIAGFTGRMGRLITSFILQDYPNATIHGICRSASKLDANTLSNPRIKTFEASSTDISALRAALAGTSVCICCYLGDNDLMVGGQKTLIDACIAEGVSRYIASDYTFDYRPLEFGDYPAKDPQKHVHQYLEEKKKTEKIRGVHILNGAFMEFVWGPLLGFINAAEATFSYYGTGDEKLDMTSMSDTAKFVAAVAMDSNTIGAVKCKTANITLIYCRIKTLLTFLQIEETPRVSKNWHSCTKKHSESSHIFSNSAHSKISTTE